FSSRRRHTRFSRDWSSDVCSSDLRSSRVVVLVSGGGSNLAALLAAHDDPAYGARVVGVVSDRPDAGGLRVAQEAGVATAVVAPRSEERSWRERVAVAADSGSLHIN